MKLRFVAMSIGLVFWAANAWALPKNPGTVFYYADAAKTQEVGFEVWGCTATSRMLVGERTAYKTTELETTDCSVLGQTGGSASDALFACGYAEIDPSTGWVGGLRKYFECVRPIIWGEG